MSVLKVGLVIGHGTGDELGAVFEKVLQHIAHRHSVTVEVIRSPRTYHSYFSLDPENFNAQEIQKYTKEDVEAFEQFCRQLVADGVRVMFKTAINAQSLYLIRQHQEAVKVEHFESGSNALLLVRDQAQGFYTGENVHEPQNDSVSRCCTFSKHLTARILAWSMERARQQWGPEGVKSVAMVYKFHLFDGIMSSWEKEWSAQYGVEVAFVQPDTANRNLLAQGLNGRQLIIAGNEWGDIMHVILLNLFGQGAQENRCTENVYLKENVAGLVEYQTVHGSADDIAYQRIVNPCATIRAASRILERHGSVTGLESRIDAILHSLERRKATTRDQGGQWDTATVVDWVLSAFDEPSINDSINRNLSQQQSENSSVFSWNKKTAVLVMDFQNDFVTAKGTGAHYRGDMSRMAGPATNIPLVISHARKSGHEVIFIRFLGDHEYQLENWRERDRALGKQPKCLAGSWGASLFDGIEPLTDEKVFDKKAHFDAFLCDGMERYLVSQQITHLILLGVYLDVCVDSTARTAFQKGYFLTVVSDCTTTLHLDFEQYLAYMKRLYGARVVKHDELIAV